MPFRAHLEAAAQRNNSRLCVGLDPNPARLPRQFAAEPDPVFAFCSAIITATADKVCAYKPNSAFFEAMGTQGLETLQRIIQFVPPEIPVILDAKRGDIGSTAAAYAHAAFAVLGAHAVTVNPYLGGDALQPFLDDAERGCFVLCKTSNVGSADLQDLLLADGRPLYLEVARLARDQWNIKGNVSLVVGATHPAALRAVRECCPDMLMLLPGIGAQGGDLALAVAAVIDRHGAGFVINASRSVLHASDGPDAIAAAAKEAQRLREAINQARAQSWPSGTGGVNREL